jgi:hypothetical protein
VADLTINITTTSANDIDANDGSIASLLSTLNNLRTNSALESFSFAFVSGDDFSFSAVGSLRTWAATITRNGGSNPNMVIAPGGAWTPSEVTLLHSMIAPLMTLSDPAGKGLTALDAVWA